MEKHLMTESDEKTWTTIMYCIMNPLVSRRSAEIMSNNFGPAIENARRKGWISNRTDFSVAAIMREYLLSCWKLGCNKYLEPKAWVHDYMKAAGAEVTEIIEKEILKRERELFPIDYLHRKIGEFMGTS